MKKQIIYLAILCFAVFTTIFSCKKETSIPPDTSLEIIVTDELGNKVQGASVALFSSESDWESGNNQIAPSQLSDVSGRVVFTQLSPKKYYWGVIKDCKNNINGSSTTTTTIAANTTNKITTVIQATGTLQLVNNSTNPYSIYINGVLTSNMEGGTTKSLAFQPTGYYTIRVLQISGYAFTPTDETFTGNLICGGSLITTFP
jgi:uncharacterized protein (DUF2141 family)